MAVTILIGDVFDKLRELPDESVHCVVTSPPYWGLRDYGVEGQIGLEPTLGEHLDVMVKVFAEVWRVLRKDGTCWINYGDCYATTPNGKKASEYKADKSDDRTFRDKPFSTVGAIYDSDGCVGFRGSYKTSKNGTEPKGRIVAGGTLKPKDLCMMSNRLAIVLQDWGWWVRSEVIWHKTNPMPESITDRPATSHEKVWLLSKSPKYFYDADAVRVESDWNPDKTKAPDGWDTGPGAHVSVHKRGRDKGKKVDKQRGHGRRHAGFNDRWDKMTKEEQTANGRNLRNVWSIATKPFSEAHFATFPPDLVIPCIKAGTSEYGVCPECGTPWQRQTEKGLTAASPKATKTHKTSTRVNSSDKGDQASNRKKDGHMPGYITTVKTLGWDQQCDCEAAAPIPATVLDPFGGAGTTGLVADRLGRDCILIELNPEYAEIARKRIYGDNPLFTEVK